MKADKLIHLLYQTTRAISQGVNQALADYGLYSSEWSIIVALNEIGPVSQIALAHYLSIEPAAISKTIVKLEEKQFIERKTGSDKREKTVYLTAKALNQYQNWEKHVDEQRQYILADLSPARQNELYTMLDSIYAKSKSIKNEVNNLTLKGTNI